MVRLKRIDVWYFHFGAKYSAICPCCKANTLYLYQNNWIKGHIIHDKNDGPEIYENIRPICLECNQDDQSYDDNFAYAVALGTMTEEERERGLTMIREAHAKRLREEVMHEKDPMRKCISMTRKGDGCKHPRKPGSEHCARHGMKTEQRIEYEYTLSCLYETRDTLRTSIRKIKAIDPTSQELSDMEERHELTCLKIRNHLKE